MTLGKSIFKKIIMVGRAPRKGDAGTPLNKPDYEIDDDGGNFAEEPEGQCGYGSCQPRSLQRLNTVQSMAFFQCLFAFWEGFVVNGLINVIIFALEIRYKLTSKKTGLIASGNDFGAFFVLLFIGHYAEGRHKPKIMSIGVVSMAIGSFVMALPHFIGENYKYVKSDNTMDSSAPANVCLNQTMLGGAANSSSGCPAGMGVDEGDAWAYPLFLVGQIFMGMGSAPMFTIGLTYLDENSKSKMTSLYTSLVMCSAAIGVAVGYIVAGQTLAFYVDFDRVDMADIDITPKDPMWVGAWWLGIVVSFAAFIVIVTPFCAFPMRLPGYNYLRRTRKSEAHGGSDTSAQLGVYKGGIKDFPKAFYKLIKNPAFVLICMASCCETLIIAGTATFGAKLLQLFFHVDIMKAGTMMGIITIPGAGGGMLLGGYLVKKFDMRCTGIIKLCGAASLISVLFTPVFLTSCDTQSVAGVTTHYAESPGALSLSSPCNENCGCTAGGMQPLCLDGKVSFFSPCHAGCPITAPNDTWKTHQCSCARQFHKKSALGPSQERDLYHNSNPRESAGDNPSKNAGNTNSFFYIGELSTRPTAAATAADDDDDDDDDGSGSEPSLKPGLCESDCKWLYVFCALFFCVMVCTFSTMTPNLTAIMRCVHHDERSLAVAIQILAGRIIGTTPGPILFGAILDSTCLTWQDGCHTTGMCWLYDQPSLSVKIMIWWASIKLSAVLLYCLALYAYKPPGASKNDNTQSNGVKLLTVASTSRTDV